VLDGTRSTRYYAVLSLTGPAQHSTVRYYRLQDPLNTVLYSTIAYRTCSTQYYAVLSLTGPAQHSTMRYYRLQDPLNTVLCSTIAYRTCRLNSLNTVLCGTIAYRTRSTRYYAVLSLTGPAQHGTMQYYRLQDLQTFKRSRGSSQ
jgi:hypothetical protein